MATYHELVAAKVSTRNAAMLTGIARATAIRKARPSVDPEPRPVRCPANKLTLAERMRVLEVLNSEEFVDQPPLQVYATLLARGQYLCSVSTMYRILTDAGQVKERRRLARHHWLWRCWLIVCADIGKAPTLSILPGRTADPALRLFDKFAARMRALMTSVPEGSRRCSWCG